MSVIRKPGDDHQPTVKKCFYCFKDFSYPYVSWMGEGATIGLHPTCFHELFIRLARDAWEIEIDPKGERRHV